MSKNEASWDRIARVVAGITLLSPTVIGPQTPWGWLGLVPLATGIWGFCPAYRLFSISTAKRSAASRKRGLALA
jgi:hypothetical protein